MKIRRLTIWGLAIAMLLAAAPAMAGRTVLVYSGKLLDERAAPIGGVFPLTFALYGKPRGGSALWSEQHFVAVDQGLYMIELGRRAKLPKKLPLDQLYVGVQITGGPEIVRERFVPEGSEPDRVVRQQGQQQPGGKAPPAAGIVDYAEKAGFAYVAEKADNAVRLDGLTLDELKKQLGGGDGGGGKVTIGSEAYNAPGAGGEGGTPFQQLCPDGYVVTGMRGGSGLYVDRVGVICSPLQQGDAKKKKKKSRR